MSQKITSSDHVSYVMQNLNCLVKCNRTIRFHRKSPPSDNVDYDKQNLYSLGANNTFSNGAITL